MDDTAWVCKTHSPWIMPEQPIFYANKMICIVRNPLDTFISWLNLVAQCNHNAKAPFDYEVTYPNYWDWWIHDIVPLFKRWIKVLMDDARLNSVPTLWIRYEDLVSDPETQLMNMMRFLVGRRDLAGTNAERRVKEQIAKGANAIKTYDLKEGTLKFNSSGKRYTEEQTAYITEELKDCLYYFGYVKTKDDPDNFTGFFKYEEDSPEYLRQHKGYEAHRERTIDWVESMTDAELAKI